ncbi:MAG: lysophospholipid acyltransferase family protein [Geminicoccaceae bacterium]
MSWTRGDEFPRNGKVLTVEQDMARLYIHPKFKDLADRYRFVDLGLRLVEMATIRTLWLVSRAIGIDRASDLGAVFGGVVGRRLRKNKHVMRNLKIVFPDRDQGWIEETAHKTWRQIGRVLAEYPHIDELCRMGEGARVTLVSEGPLEDIRNAPVGMVFLAMHQANWNLPALAGALGNFPLDVIFAEQKHSAFEAMIASHRNRMPCGFIHVRDVPRKMIAALRQGRGVGLFVDHRIDGGDPVPFFGHDAQTTTIPARIACKLGTGVVPTRIERLDGAYFRLTLGRPVYPDPDIAGDHEAAHSLMCKVHERFEEWVRARPEDWCCVKRRWSSSISKPARRGIAAGMDKPPEIVV